MKRNPIYLHRILPCLLAAAGVLVAGAARVSDTSVSVWVSIAPYAGLVERLGRRHVHVSALLKAGQEPHDFEPTPKQVMALAQADVYLKVGTLPFETPLLKKVRGSHPSLVVVDTWQVTAPEAESLARTDPHVWLSPAHLGHVARQVAAALIDAAPLAKPDIEKNLGAFMKDLKAADERIRRRLAPYSGRTVLVFHPALGHFAAAYGLKQRAVETEGKSPTPRQLQDLVKQVREDGVRTVFVQPQFERASAGAVARAIGGTVEVIDPLAMDVVANLEDIAAKVEAALARELGTKENASRVQ